MTSDVVDLVRNALPSYKVEGEIARGGFGVVLFGTHQSLQRKVAIKLLPAEVANDPVIRHRFAAEARLMAGIDHPHIVRVHDYVENENVCLFVMEYLSAGTVLDRFTSKGFDPTTAIGVALACASALEEAHSHGFLHRDVKPANLMFAANGTVKLSDFGIAKIIGGETGGKTKAGDVIGTAWYIAPEQVLGTEITPATDIYALSTTLYQLLAGTLPFPTQAESMAIYAMHAYGQPTPLLSVKPNLPAEVAEVVMRGLETDPRRRWRTAEEFGVALASAATHCWGPNWLAQAGVPVLGNESIKAATAAISSPAVGSISWTSAPTVQIRPGPGRNVVDGDAASPKVPYIIAGALGVLAILLALIGLGSPPRGGDLKPGTVTIAGVDPVTAGEVKIDMSKPIEVTATGDQGDTAALSQNVLGVSIGDHDAPLVAEGPTSTAELEPPNPYILAGSTTAELRVMNGDDTTASFRFGVRSTQSAFTTAFAGAVLFLALFAVAYIESFTRMLRRGRNQMSAKIGIPIAAAVLAVALVGAIWVVVGREPTIATLIGCALIGAGAGVSGSIAAVRQGVLNNRMRRSQRTPRPSGQRTPRPPAQRTPRPTVKETPRPTKVSGQRPGRSPRPEEGGDKPGDASGDRPKNKGTKIDRG